MLTKLLGITSVNFDVTDQLLITCCTWVRYWGGKKKWDCICTVCRLYTQRKRVSEQKRMCIICNECDMPIKLVQLIKMRMNYACNTVHVRNHFCDTYTIHNGLKQVNA